MQKQTLEEYGGIPVPLQKRKRYHNEGKKYPEITGITLSVTGNGQYRTPTLLYYENPKWRSALLAMG